MGYRNETTTRLVGKMGRRNGTHSKSGCARHSRISLNELLYQHNRLGRCQSRLLVRSFYTKFIQLECRLSLDSNDAWWVLTDAIPCMHVQKRSLMNAGSTIYSNWFTRVGWTWLANESYTAETQDFYSLLACDVSHSIPEFNLRRAWPSDSSALVDHGKQKKHDGWMRTTLEWWLAGLWYRNK